METNRVNAALGNTSLPTSTLLAQKPKIDPNAPKFLQALAEAIDATTPKVLPAEPAVLSGLVRPRAHLDLKSLNPVQTSYEPQAAALERVGKSRIFYCQALAANGGVLRPLIFGAFVVQRSQIHHPTATQAS